MPVWFRSYFKFLIAICLVVSFCFIEGEAQTRRKRRARRATKPPAARPVITNPPIAPAEGTAETAAAGDVKIISTDDPTQEPAPATEPRKAKTTATPAAAEQEGMQQTITTLSNQVNKLTDRLTQMQEDDRYQLDMERLTRAEQRAEQLRSQLMDIQGKIADFESRLEQVEYDLKPENIERITQGYGTVHPEQARDSRKKQLESERSRLQAQLKLADTSRSRLEVAVSNADAEVDNLRAKLNQRREQMEAAPPVNESPRPRKPE
jgi:small-conductance mechanosensitive channel